MLIKINHVIYFKLFPFSHGNHVCDKLRMTNVQHNCVTNINVADIIPDSDQWKSALSCSTYQRNVFISSTAVINILIPVRRKLTPKIKLLNIHKMTQL